MTDPLHRDPPVDFHTRFRAALMLSAFIVFLVAPGFLQGSGDFDQFFIAARRLAMRQNPYVPFLFTKAYPFGFPYPPMAIYWILPLSKFVLPTAVHVWDLICLVAYAVLIYWWIDIIWRRAPTFEMYARIFVAASIAPCSMAFFAHNENILILFFGTAAYRLALKGRYPLLAGIFSGLFMTKPHLTFMPTLELLSEIKRKRRFVVGFFFILIVSILPFLNTYRPLQDLRQMRQSAVDYSTKAYFSDEQNAMSGLYRLSWLRWQHPEIHNETEAPGLLGAPSIIAQHTKVKAVGLLICIGIWMYWRRRQSGGPSLFIAALTLNVLGAFYSHSYDSLFILPLVMTTLYHASQRFHLSNIAGVLLLLNTLILCTPLWTPNPHELNWSFFGFYSLIYASGCFVYEIVFPTPSRG